MPKYLLPQKIVNMFKKRECRYNLRGKYKLEKIKSRLKPKDQSTTVMGVNIWNELDNELKVCQTIHKFKRLFKKKVIEKYMRTNED